MGHLTASQYGLRARVDAHDRPLGQQTDRQRAMQAAFEVLKGTISPTSAKSKYRVSNDSLRDYKTRLVKDGVAEIIASVPEVAPALVPTPSTADSEKENGSNPRDNYCRAYVRAGELMNKGVGKNKAAEQAAAEFSVNISPSTAARAAERPGEEPSRPGRKLGLGPAIEAQLETLCEVLREMRIPIFQEMIINFANTLIRGTALEDEFKHQEIRRDWYYRWLGRCKYLKTANIRPLEITRAKWATAKNAYDHYEVLKELMLELGLAVRNPAFVEGEELSQLIIITKPGRIFSMDETRLTNDATTPSKAKGNRTLICTDGDCGEVIVNKGGGDGTGIGGTSADGLDLPGFFIFAGNIIHAGENDEDVAAHNCPACRRADPTDPSRPMPCRFWTNAKGGVTSDFGVRYIQGCVEPCLPDLSPDNPALLIMDGHGSHFTLELLHYCRGRGLHIVLRPPHTTHVLQGEDVQHFAIFKPRYLRAKFAATQRRFIHGQNPSLTAGDLLLCAKEAWETAFNLEHSLRAWA